MKIDSKTKKTFFTEKVKAAFTKTGGLKPKKKVEAMMKTNRPIDFWHIISDHDRHDDARQGHRQ